MKLSDGMYLRKAECFCIILICRQPKIGESAFLDLLSSFDIITSLSYT